MLRCMACGSLRKDEAFGINHRGELEGLPDRELQRATQTIGGRGRCSWNFADVTPAEALSLLKGLREAADRVAHELRRAGFELESDDDVNS